MNCMLKGVTNFIQTKVDFAKQGPSSALIRLAVSSGARAWSLYRLAKQDYLNNQQAGENPS